MKCYKLHVHHFDGYIWLYVSVFCKGGKTFNHETNVQYHILVYIVSTVDIIHVHTGICKC